MSRQLGTVEQFVRFVIGLQLAVAGHVTGHYSPVFSGILYTLAFLLLASTLWQKFRRASYLGPERRRTQNRYASKPRLFSCLAAD